MITKNTRLRFPVEPALRCLVLASGAILGVSGQTAINLATQARNIDFTNAQYTRPLKTGTALPATCSTGDMFFNISAPAGQNLYGCVATNSWGLQSSAIGLADPGSNGLVLRTGPNATTAIAAPLSALVGITDTQTLANKSIDGSEITSGTVSPLRFPAFSGDFSTTAGSTNATLATVNANPGTFGDAAHSVQLTVDGKGRITNISTLPISGGTGGASLTTQLLDFAPNLSGSSATFGGSCAPLSPCLVYLNGARYVFTNGSSVSVSGSSTDTIFFYVSGTGMPTLGYNSSNTYTGTNITVVSGITAFPQGVYPLFQCNVGAGSITACSDYRPILSSTSFSNGQGTAVSQSGGVMSINLTETVDNMTSNFAIPGTACGHLELMTVPAGGGTWGLPQPGVGGMVLNGCVIEFHNAGTGTATITPTSATINGASSLSLAAGHACRVISDGTNYQTGVCP